MNIHTLKNNFYGGITASVVALPLALAFGVASGAGAISGIYGAILVGFFAAIFGGTPTQISGPTGPMTVVMAGIISLFISKYPENGISLAFTTVMMGGLFQILLGYLKVGRFINLVPYTVVSGFMNGIGVIIILLQIMPFLGIEHVANNPLAVVLSLYSELEQIKYPTALLGVSLLIILLYWPSTWNKWIPSPLFCLIAGTLASLYLFDAENFIRIGEMPSGVITFQIPVFEMDILIEMMKFAIVLGSLGSIDSLLTSLVADGITRSEHDSDKELIGQGIGNLAAGVFGGLPGAGATMRTVVNIRSGGTSLLSGVIHSLSLVLMVSFAGSMIATVPMVALAAILIKVGLDIIDWEFLKRLTRAPASSISIVVSVFLLTVFVDLITAVGMGVIISSLYTVNRLSKEQLEQARPRFGKDLLELLTKEEKHLLEGLSESILLYSLSGPFSFGAAKGLSKKLVAYSSYDVLILDLLGVSSIDTSTALSIEGMVISNREIDRYVIVVCGDPLRDTFERLGIIDLIGEQKIFSSRKEAFIKAKILLSKIEH